MARSRGARAAQPPVKASSPPRARKATAKEAPAKAPAAKAAKAARKATAKKASTRAAAEKAVARKAAGKKAAGTKATPKKATPKKAAGKKAAGRKATPKKAAGRKAAGGRGRSAFPARFLEAQRAALVEERTTYLGQAETLQAEAESLVADVDPGDVQFDEESGEGDTLAVERERDLALSAQARQAVEEIDHALEKLDQGTYGLCEVDQAPIPKERLEAIPWARTCVEHKIGGFGRR